METKAIRNLGLKLGLVGGVCIIAYFFALYYTGISLFDPFYKADFWVTIPMTILGIYSIRKVSNGLRFWQGLVLGFYVFIVCASIAALFYYVFLTFIDPDFMHESFVQRLVDLNQLKGTTAEQIKYIDDAKINITEISQNSTPLDVALDKIIVHYVVGVIVTVFFSVVFRK